MSENGVFSIFTAKTGARSTYKPSWPEKLVGYIGVILFIPISWYYPAQTHQWARLMAMVFFPSWMFAFIIAGLFSHRTKELIIKVFVGTILIYCLLMVIIVVLWKELPIIGSTSYWASSIGLTFMMIVFLAFEVLRRLYPMSDSNNKDDDQGRIIP
jgi:hypothetical protein